MYSTMNGHSKVLNLLKNIFSLLITFMVVSNCTSFGEKGTSTPTLNQVKTIGDKVANWQIKTFDSMGKYRALPPKNERKNFHHRRKHHDLDWTCAALYAGMCEWATISIDDTYEKWLTAIGMRHQWKLNERMYHADDHAAGQLFLKIYDLYGHRKVINPLIKQFDSIMSSEQGKRKQWYWADALFMAPPVWAELSKATGNKKYLEYMDSQYHQTYNLLWDKEEQFFFRDKSFLKKTEKNGKKLFWARGNGWVFGGLALMIPDLPKDWEGKSFYTNIFQQMAESLKKSQRPDGTWSSGILGGVEAYPVKEISGSAFFVYGLAWGINQGVLDKEIYQPIMLKGWHALTKCVTEEGLVGYIQPIGAAPGNSFKDYTEVYGVGAFLAAATEVYKFVEAQSSKVSKDTQAFQTFMKDGGWCWYQDPRAVINNGKLVFGGLSGQTGDVKLGVYDLKKDTVLGNVVLHEKFEKDDHNVPALYVRPDHSILAIWAKHAHEKKHYSSISSPSNYLEWGERKEFVHDYKAKVGVTYMNLYHMKDEGLLYNFFRDGPSFNPSYITSPDHGITWGDRTHFIADEVNGRQRPYTKYLKKDENTVGIAFTDGHPRNYGNSLYYSEFKNGVFYNVDGTKIKMFNKEPLKTSEAEKIYIGSETSKKPKECESVPNSAWPCIVEKDENNRPHIGYSLYVHNEDHRFRIASWNGEKWVDREIAYAGKSLYTLESSYTGLMAFDPTDVTRVYISTDVDPSTGKNTGGLHEIYTAEIGIDDDVSTIKWEPITKKSKYRNIRPILVSGEGYKVLLWLNGSWNSFFNYNTDVKGLILKS
ncbi:glycoside hydrolase family 88 protein [Flavivirga algicola]|uniref:Glycosyl hydrolase n=1 Tax=Flavivirga algicola TaxID=2729136 RepID=A0ABX1RTI8_9FLAO|nr:glycoside hydrolase family 88 protein [Flavivirga algicola]NMH86861.1 glycosyl hydrolase [Flavivirga algicola]